MTLAKCLKLCHPVRFWKLQSCHVWSLSVVCFARQGRRGIFALAPGAVVLRAVRIPKSCPCVVFDSKLVQNSWMCTPFNGGGRMNFTIKILQSHEFYNQEIVKSWKSLSRFSWPWLQRRASCPLVPSGLGPVGQTNVLWAGPRIIHEFFNGWINGLIINCLIR